MDDTHWPALAAEGLTLSWDGGATHVVEDVSLAVGAGETCCVVGRSGCGKTTLLHALAGLERPVAGRVLVHGADVTGVPGRVSYMLQKDLLLPNLRVIDNVCLPLTLAGTRRADAHAQAAPLLERCGLAESAHLWPAELSGGMRQRAAFARTCLAGADVVLLDEPFSALDALTRADLRRWFAELSADMGLAALVITHDVDEALLMGERVHVLSGNPAAGVASRVVATVVAGRGGSAGAAASVDPKARRAIIEALG